jgi:hypothetical protein
MRQLLPIEENKNEKNADPKRERERERENPFFGKKRFD